MTEEDIIQVLTALNDRVDSKSSNMSASLSLLVTFARANGIQLDVMKLWKLFQQIPREEESKPVMQIQICLN